MKQKNKNIDLEDITLTPITMEHHRTALRRSLVTSPYWDKKQTNIFVFWKGGEETMKKRKVILTGLTLVVMVLATAVSTVLLPKNTKTAYAEEVAKKSYEAVVTLTPEQRAELKHKVMGGDPKEMLEKAKHAKDLTVLTYEQFVSQQPAPPPGEPEGQGPDLHSLNFLQFTDDDGSRVILGVDPKNNLPVIIMVRNGIPEGSSSMPNMKYGFEKGVHFGSSDKQTKTEMGVMMNADGTGTIVVNGKKYAVPEGVNLSTGEPPSIKMEGDAVYINGIKAAPEE